MPWRNLTPQIAKDMKKCEFDLENVSLDSKHFGPKELMGYQTLDNDFAFMGLCAGGDWELPVFFIIYWSGKGLRAYVPVDGNPWNTTTKCAYGNSYDDGFSDGKNLKKRYPEIFDEQTPMECNDDFTRMNLEPDKIIADIKKRIVEK